MLLLEIALLMRRLVHAVASAAQRRLALVEWDEEGKGQEETTYVMEVGCRQSLEWKTASASRNGLHSINQWGVV